MRSVSQSHYYSSSPHPLIAHYCLSSSAPLLASFACLTSLDTRVSHFIRFSHSLAPELPFQSPRMGKYHHLPSRLLVPGCQTLPKKVSEPGWLVPLQFRAFWSQLGSQCCLAVLVLMDDVQLSRFPVVSIPRFPPTLGFCVCVWYDHLVLRESQGWCLIPLFFFSLCESSPLLSDLIGKRSPISHDKAFTKPSPSFFTKTSLHHFLAFFPWSRHSLDLLFCFLPWKIDWMVSVVYT